MLPLRDAPQGRGGARGSVQAVDTKEQGMSGTGWAGGLRLRGAGGPWGEGSWPHSGIVTGRDRLRHH